MYTCEEKLIVPPYKESFLVPSYPYLLEGGVLKRGGMCIKHYDVPPEDAKFVRYVREAGGLGDIVRVLAVGEELKKKYKNAKVHLFGPAWEVPLLTARAKHAFDMFVPCEWGARERDHVIDESIHKHLKTEIKYDVTVDGWCPAYLHEAGTKGYVCQDRTELWCRYGGVDFVRPYLSPTKEDDIFCETYKKANGRRGPIIGIQPGATCPSREWPYYYWNELCKLLKEQLGAHIVLFDSCLRSMQGGIEAKYVEPSIQRPWNETIGKILACDLLVTPDSGFYHLSGTLYKKCLGLFGCTSGVVTSRTWQMGVKTGYYLELSEDEIDYSLLPTCNHNGKPCMPKCYMQWCRGFRPDRYRKEGHSCELLRQLHPKRVFSEVLSLLQGKP